RWTEQGRAVIRAVATRCGDDAERMRQCGFTVGTPRPGTPAGTPTRLRNRHTGQRGTVGVKWDSDGRGDEHEVQWAADPAEPSPCSARVPAAKRAFALPGQVTGAVLWFRVRAVDARLPEGHTSFTAWVAVRVP